MTVNEYWYFVGWQDMKNGYTPRPPMPRPACIYYRAGFYDRLEFVRSKRKTEI